MRVKPALLFLSLGLFSLTPQFAARAQTEVAATAQRERDASAAALVRLIVVQLDATWNVQYRPQFDLIEVQSRQQFLIEQPVFPSQPALFSQPVEDGQTLLTTHLEFWLRVKPFISPADYARFQAENAKVEAQLAPMAAQLKRIEGKPGAFWPRNPEEKQLVEQYRLTKAKLHDLPMFYFQDASLDLTFIYGQPVDLFGNADDIGDQAEWRRQQREAALRVTKLLTRYSTQAQ